MSFCFPPLCLPLLSLSSLSRQYKSSQTYFGWSHPKPTACHLSMGSSLPHPVFFRPTVTNRFLDSRILRFLDGPPDDVTHLRMFDLPRCTSLARQAMKAFSVDHRATYAAMWLASRLPKRNPTAMRIASSDSRSPTAVIGGAWSQSPACGVAAALNLAVSV